MLFKPAIIGLVFDAYEGILVDSGPDTAEESPLGLLFLNDFQTVYGFGPVVQRLSFAVGLLFLLLFLFNCCVLHDDQFLQVLHFLPHAGDHMILPFYLAPQLLSVLFVELALPA